MKGLKACNSRIILSLVCASLILPLTASRAQVYTLTAPNAVVSGDGSGLTDWIVNGADYLNQQFMFVRVGAAAQESQLTGGTFTAALFNPRSGSVTYLYPGLRVRETLTLAGSAGSGESRLSQDISISNLSGSPMTLSFFLYTDFNLPGIASLDYVTIQPFTYARQYNAAGYMVDQNVLSSDIPAGAEAGNAAALLAKFTDSGATVLSGPLSAGPGDMAWAFQWDLSLAAGAGANLSIIYSVPEPACVALGFAGLLVAGLFRRTQNG